MVQAKTINLLLYDGDLSGVISIADSGWNSGELYSAPRDSIEKLIEYSECKKYGVYLLLSKDMVYVGQASDLAKRINQHLIGKSWWESVVLLTTKDDSFTHTDIDYIESVLIEKAQKIGRLDCDNKNKGNKQKVDKYVKVVLDQYINEALFLLQLIGITVFTENGQSTGKTVFNTLNQRTLLQVGKRAKKEAVSYLKESGYEIGKDVSYAIIQSDKNEFWVNPKVDLLEKEWWIILNDNRNNELILLKVPAGALKLTDSDGVGLKVRSDKPALIDLNINAEKLVDRKSNVGFSSFVINRVNY